MNTNAKPADYVGIEKGDYIAVSTFMTAVLPVIASTDHVSRTFFLPTTNQPSTVMFSNPDLVKLSYEAILASATVKW